MNTVDVVWSGGRDRLASHELCLPEQTGGEYPPLPCISRALLHSRLSIGALGSGRDGRKVSHAGHSRPERQFSGLPGLALMRA